MGQKAILRMLLGCGLLVSGHLMATVDQAAKKVTLTEAITIALENNNDLKAQSTRVDKARSTAMVATSGFYPTVNFASNYQYISPVPAMNLNIFLPVGGPAGTSLQKSVPIGFQHNQTLSLIVSQNIFNSGADYYQKRAAELGIDMAKFNESKVRDDTIVTVASQYYMIILLTEQKSLLEQTIRQKRVHLEEIKVNYRGGIASELEKLQSEVALETLLPDLDDIDNKITLAKLALAKTLGIKADPVGKIAFRQATGQLAEFEKRALNQNPVLSTIEKHHQMLTAQKSAVTAHYWPSVSLMAKGDYGNPSDMKDEWGTSYTLMANLTWSLFDGFATRGKVAEVAADDAEISYLAASARENTTLAVRTAFYNERAIEARLLSLNHTIALAEKTMAVAQTGYVNGTATGSAVRDAELDVLRTKIARAQALYEHIVAQFTLHSAMGDVQSLIATWGGSQS